MKEHLNIDLSDLQITMSDLEKLYKGNFESFIKDKLIINIKNERKNKLIHILKTK